MNYSLFLFLFLTLFLFLFLFLYFFKSPALTQLMGTQKLGSNQWTSSNITLFVTDLSEVGEFLQDDYNFETSLRLLNDIKLQTHIQSLNPVKFRIKQLVSHLFTRHVLNKVLKNSLNFLQVQFAYNEYGKPLINNLEFNSSSSNDIIALVVCNGSAIGIDLSHLEQNISSERYLDEFKPIFSEHEVEQVNSYFKFNHFWTLKESFTKLLGCGLNIDLADFYFKVGDGFNEDEYARDYKYCVHQQERSQQQQQQQMQHIQQESEIERHFELKWFSDITINADTLFIDKCNFVSNIRNEFYCCSSVLKKGNIGGTGGGNGNREKLPVIISLITSYPIKSIKCFDINMTALLQRNVHS